MSTDSYIVIGSERLRPIVARVIEEIDRLRQEGMEKVVDSVVKDNRKSWLRKVFPYAAPSREQIRDSLQCADLMYASRRQLEYYWASRDFDESRALAQTLLTATNFAHEVHVSVADLANLNRYLPSEDPARIGAYGDRIQIGAIEKVDNPPST